MASMVFTIEIGLLIFDSKSISMVLSTLTRPVKGNVSAFDDTWSEELKERRKVRLNRIWSGTEEERV
jgi:hypothetical protein